MIDLLVLIAIGMFLYRRFLKKELYDNKNFTYVLCGLLVIAGGYYILIGLIYRNLLLIIFGPIWLYGSYRELQRARLLETRVLEETEILEEEVETNISEEEVDETNGRKFLIKAPTNPANFAIGCVTGAMFYININFFIILGVILALRFISPKKQAVPGAEGDNRRGFLPIQSMLLFIGGMIGTTILLQILLGVPAIE